ncbi:MAG: hypothetical protein JXR84_15350 [Anaerolineae bacterium]|nr:hypothetical protein [Anaerolineae bacterium]
MDRALLSEHNAVDALLLPQTLTVAAHTATDISVKGYTRAMLKLALGAAASGATIDVVVSHATAAGGTYATLFTATQLTEAGGDDEKVHYLDIDLLNPNIRNYLKVVVTVGTDTVLGYLEIELSGAREEAVTQPDMEALAGTWATGIIPS